MRREGVNVAFGPPMPYSPFSYEWLSRSNPVARNATSASARDRRKSPFAVALSEREGDAKDRLAPNKAITLVSDNGSTTALSAVS